MRFSLLLMITAAICLLQSCSSTKGTAKKKNEDAAVSKPVSGNKNNIPARIINTKNVPADSVVRFAETLIGIRYKYGSAIKEEGFDCSGFITYVFAHFNIAVPRSSVDFTNVGTSIPLAECRKGDLILFTGSDTSSRIVGHMGIITQNKQGNIRFIHSASGNAKGVMISGMTNYFSTRFVKVIRIFK